MQTKLKSILVLLLIILQGSEQTEAACTCAATTCDCSDITRFPQGLNVPTNTTVLTLRDSQITSLNNFPNLPQLQSLSLVSNQMTSISSGAFSNLPQVQNITLDSNNMTSIASRAFTNLAQLKKVVLYNNRMTGIDRSAFSDLPQLQQLDLDSNQITSIRLDAFANLPQLQTLDLSNTRLGDYDIEGGLSNLTQLQTLSLSYNRISNIPPGAFSNLTSLQELDLSSNRISATDLLTRAVCTELSSIPTVNLSNNPWRCDCGRLDQKGLTCPLNIIKQVRCEGSDSMTYPLTLKDGKLVCNTSTSAASDLHCSLYHLPLILLSALLLKTLLV